MLCICIVPNNDTDGYIYISESAVALSMYIGMAHVVLLSLYIGIGTKSRNMRKIDETRLYRVKYRTPTL